MVIASLQRGISLLFRNPFLWLPGLVTGVLGALDLLLQYSFGTFLASRVWIIEALLIPFFIAGAYAQIRSGERGAGTFFTEAKKNYFRVLLPSLLIAFAILATVILLAIPLMFMGITEVILPFAAIGCIIPILFFTFFSDTAAVFEDRGVFECIRRSVEVVMNRPGRVIAFFLVMIGIFILVSLPLAIIWTGLLYDQLLPLASMDPTRVETLTMATLNEMLGYRGIVITAIFYFTWVTIAGSIITVFKAAFYQDTCQSVSDGSPVILQGEYDEKGRWYKY